MDIPDPLDYVVQDSVHADVGNVAVQWDHCFDLSSLEVDMVLLKVSEDQHNRKDLMGGNHLDIVSEMGYRHHGHLDNLQA